MYGAIAAKLLWQLVPSAACTQTKDNAIENTAQMQAAMPLEFIGVAVVEDRFDHRPYVIRYFPNWGLSCGVHDNPPLT